MKLYSVRLKPGQDLRKELLAFAKTNHIQAGSIGTCVGALKSVTLRMAGATPNKQDLRTFNQPYEIVSLVGTVTGKDCHLHIALADKEGTVIGGHLKESVVDPTAEIVIADDESAVYIREIDNETKFEELVIKPRNT